jgi:threonine dehydrogenase-like Zn-dependent dehydrogenase
MKAVVFHGIGDIRLDNVSEPKIKDKTDAIIRITTSAICGTDLHMVRGTVTDMKSGTILGHEAVGVIEEIGSEVRDFKPGDRVVVSSSIACGYCAYCRVGYFSQCDNANPNGKRAGTAFFGGPKSSGSFDGLQAEKARIPFANIGLVKLPDSVTDDQAIVLSDIFPTGYFGAHIAEINPGNTVAVFGCGQVGLFAIYSALEFFKAGRVFAIDRVPYRLELARDLGAEIINFEEDDPIETILNLTGGIGVDRVIEAVGIDAEPPRKGPALKEVSKDMKEYQRELKEVAPKTHPRGSNWKPGEAPSLALRWSVEALAKAGTLSIIGVYPETANVFPIGEATSKNLTVKMGNCPHRKYIPTLINYIESRAVHPERLVTNITPLESVIDAYKAFDLRQPGWVKVEVVPRRETVLV